jgi:hypothetical protein
MNLIGVKMFRPIPTGQNPGAKFRQGYLPKKGLVYDNIILLKFTLFYIIFKNTTLNCFNFFKFHLHEGAYLGFHW